MRSPPLASKKHVRPPPLCYFHDARRTMGSSERMHIMRDPPAILSDSREHVARQGNAPRVAPARKEWNRVKRELLSLIERARCYSPHRWLAGKEMHRTTPASKPGESSARAKENASRDVSDRSKIRPRPPGAESFARAQGERRAACMRMLSRIRVRRRSDPARRSARRLGIAHVNRAHTIAHVHARIRAGMCAP